MCPFGRLAFSVFSRSSRDLGTKSIRPEDPAVEAEVDLGRSGALGLCARCRISSRLRLGPQVVPVYPFFGEGSPTKIENIKRVPLF